MEHNTFITQVKRVIEQRINEANTAGNPGLAEKWTKELSILSNDNCARVLAEQNVDPDIFGYLAVYAAQKVRRLVTGFLGIGGVDPYTKTMVLSAKRLGGSIANAAMTASIAGSIGTASTQASSTRSALIALGAAKVIRGGKDRTFEIDLSHPIIERIS
jgi:hypothetical protein